MTIACGGGAAGGADGDAMRPEVYLFYYNYNDNYKQFIVINNIIIAGGGVAGGADGLALRPQLQFL